MVNLTNKKLGNAKQKALDSFIARSKQISILRKLNNGMERKEALEHLDELRKFIRKVKGSPYSGPKKLEELRQLRKWIKRLIETK
jgi:hypothetical protein